MTRRRQNGRASRRGAVLVAALVCLAVVMAILLVSVQSSLRLRRQMHRELQMEQTRWLADAGVRQGIARLAEQPDYTGQTLTIETGQSRCPMATVEIAVIRDQSGGDVTRLRATARVGGLENETQKTQRTEEVIFGQQESDYSQ